MTYKKQMILMGVLCIIGGVIAGLLKYHGLSVFCGLVFLTITQEYNQEQG